MMFLTVARRVPVLACAGMLTLIICGCAASGTFTGGHAIRIMTYNIHHGTRSDGTFDIDRIAEVIRSSDADIVALQDVDRGTDRAYAFDELTALADQTKMTYAFSRSEDLGSGEHGNALLTRFAILEEKSELFTLQSSRQPCSLMRLVLDVDGTSIILMNTELAGSTNDTVQRDNVSELTRFAQATESVPTIFCGSISPTSDSSTFTPLVGMFTDCWTISGAGDGATYPASRPGRRIDFIFVSVPHAPTDTKSPGINIRPTGAEVLPDTASNHRPLLVTADIISK